MNVPQELLAVQKWFGSTITLPLGELSEPLELPSYDESVKELCTHYLTDSPYLKSHERIGIYNRLYWYRLYLAFHTAFPFVTRLFGYDSLHAKIVQPYLRKYPPSHWSLSRMSDRFLQWLEEEYHAKDKHLIAHAARLDLAYEKVFLAPAQVPLTRITEGKIVLQPFVKAFHTPADFFTLREKFLAQTVEYWEKHAFPPLHYDRDYYFVLHRSPEGIKYAEICPVRYFILQQLEKGILLPDLCHALEDRVFNPNDLQQWFCAWTASGWLYNS